MNDREDPRDVSLRRAVECVTVLVVCTESALEERRSTC